MPEVLPAVLHATFFRGSSRATPPRAFRGGTLAVNVAGCLAIGLLYGLFERGNLLNAELRLFLTVGFCGGFTTFSTFIHENYALLGGQQFLHFAGYALLSFALGMLAAHLGHLLVRVF